MSHFRCLNYRAISTRTTRNRCVDNLLMRCFGSQSGPQNGPQKHEKLDIDSLLSKPTWSVKDLFPDASQIPKDEVSRPQLHHLLRLSALPQPKSADEEEKMLKDLHAQLYFMRNVQSVDTTNVEPLISIRDETAEGIKEQTIGVEDLKEELANERIQGRRRRPRRNRDVHVDTKGVEDWDVLGTASRTVGKYFVVNSSRAGDREKQ